MNTPSLQSALRRWWVAGLISVALLPAGPSTANAQTKVYLTDVPDYDWHAGCFGTASGNLMGYWDRHGFPNFYTGPTGGGLAPLDSFGGNIGIRSMWASQAGVDGRPANLRGHMDDYYVSYESSAADPYVTGGWAEHTPDCIGDFIGVNQRKWTKTLQNGECYGNVDAYSFVFWDTTGRRRTNFDTNYPAGLAPRDIQTGLREWTSYRGYDSDVFTQLAEFEPHRTTTNGFSFADMKREIDSGFPVLLFLQPTNQTSHTFGNLVNANPYIHGVMVYGYVEDAPELGISEGVIIRTSWASGDNQVYPWAAVDWFQDYEYWLQVRGVIGYRPRPKVSHIGRNEGNVTLTWDGPDSHLHDEIAGTTTPVSRYCVQKSATLNPPNWQPVGLPTTDHTVTFADCCGATVFYRVVLLDGDNCPVP